MTSSERDSRTAILPTIYAALAAGVFLYAVIVVLAVGPLESGLDPTILRVGWFAVAVGATLAAGLIRGRATAAGDSPRRAVTGAVVVWALAEGQALVGITGYLLSGDTVVLVVSLVLFAYLWLRYPPRAFSPGR
jgi:hypothetical protein